MRGKERKSDDLALMSLLQQVGNGDHVAERFRHFLRPCHRQKAVMHPVTCERCPIVAAAALRNFVFVVRKMRSRPPAWMSIVSPRCRSIIAEHSICQPGRPLPQGLSQPITPASEGFQSTKSAGSF